MNSLVTVAVTDDPEVLRQVPVDGGQGETMTNVSLVEWRSLPLERGVAYMRLCRRAREEELWERCFLQLRAVALCPQIPLAIRPSLP